MSKAKISINQFTEFSASSEAKKLTIIKNQLKPNKLLIPWYASAKTSIKSYLVNVNDLTPLHEGIKKQLSRNITSDRQKIDKQVSIEALQKLITLKIAPFLRGLKYEVIKPEVKLINIEDVDITISPEIIIKVFIKNQVIYGGVKIHISKGAPFTQKQCSYSSTLLCEYIKTNVAKTGEKVDPKLCLCIDVFGERIVPASEAYLEELMQIRQTCSEIKQIWEKVA